MPSGEAGFAGLQLLSRPEIESLNPARGVLTFLPACGAGDFLIRCHGRPNPEEIVRNTSEKLQSRDDVQICIKEEEPCASWSWKTKRRWPKRWNRGSKRSTTKWPSRIPEKTDSI